MYVSTHSLCKSLFLHMHVPSPCKKANELGAQNRDTVRRHLYWRVVLSAPSTPFPPAVRIVATFSCPCCCRSVGSVRLGSPSTSRLYKTTVLRGQCLRQQVRVCAHTACHAYYGHGEYDGAPSLRLGRQLLAHRPVDVLVGRGDRLGSPRKVARRPGAHGT